MMTDNQREDETALSRRAMARAAGGTVLASSVAGCFGGFFDGILEGGKAQQKTPREPSSPATTTQPSKTPTEPPGAIRGLTPDGLALQVTLGPSSGVTHVNLIGPNGRAIRQKRVSTGQTTVNVALIGWVDHIYNYQPLPAGQYEIVAAQNTTVVDRVSLDLSLAYSVSQLDVVVTQVANEQPLAERSYPSVPTDIAVTLTNTGNTPLKLSKLAFTDGVPDPTPIQDGGGMIRMNDQIDAQWSQYIGVNRRATFKTQHSPLSYPGKQQFVIGQETPEIARHWRKPKQQCRGKTKPATLTCDLAHLGQQTHSVSITYGGKPLTLSDTDTDWVCEKATVSQSPKDA